MEFREARLENGLEIVAECNDEAHTTAVGFFVRTGARDETRDVAGVSHFLEHMVFKGTPTRSAEDVNREFDEMGAQYNAQTSEESTIYYASVLPEFQNRVVALWADVLRPSLREEDFRTEKQVIIEEIRMYEDQPPFSADEQCRELFFGSHPLAHSVLGTTKSITNLRAEEMRRYFQSRYSPGNITLAAAGRVDFQSLVASARQACGAWEPAPAPRATPLPSASSAFKTVEKSSANQEYLIQLAPAPSATDERRHAARLLSTALGDDAGSRLYWEIVHPGLAEYASQSHYEYDGAGVYMTYMCCEPESAAANVQRILDVYRRAETEGIAEKELVQAKSKLTSRVVLGSERSRSRMFSVGGNWIYRHEYRTVKEQIEQLAAVTTADLGDVLAAYPLSRSASIAVGPLASVKPPR